MKERSGFNEGSKRLALAFGLYMVALAAITLLGRQHILTSLATHLSDAELVKTAGRQSLLSESIALEALKTSKQAGALSEASRAQLQTEVGEFRRHNSELLESKNAAGFVTALNKLQPFERSVEEQTFALLNAANRQLRTRAASNLLAIQPKFLALMDDAARELDREIAVNAGANLVWNGTTLPIIRLLVAGAFASLLLFPVFRELRLANRRLEVIVASDETKALMLEERNLELEAQGATLVENEAALLLKSDQLTESMRGSDIAARRFEALFQGLPVACVGFDRSGVIYDWNRGSTILFGYQPYEVLHQPMWDKLGNDQFERQGRLVIEQVFRGRSFEEIEWEFTRKDGKARQILCRVFPLRGIEGEIVGGVAACLDVTEARQAETELRASEALFRDLVDSLHEGVLVYDETGAVITANRQACVIFNKTKEELNGWCPVNEPGLMMDEEGTPYSEDRLPCRVCQATGIAVEGLIVGLKATSEDASNVWLSVNLVPLRKPGTATIHGVLSSFTNVTERLNQDLRLQTQAAEIAKAHDELQVRQERLEIANRQLETLATTDGLTGLNNHRSFQERLDLFVAHSLPGLMSLALLDVDHFKQYNDSFGHPEGDDVLRRLAKLLDEKVRTIGVAARYGGEEFALILPGMDEKTAIEFVSDICQLLADQDWPLRQVTISGGVTTFCQEGMTPAELVKQADEALYAAKRRGRNQAFGYSSFLSAA